MSPDARIAQWVDQYAARLYRAAALLTSEAEAPDVCQDVFLIAARKHAHFDGESSPYSWLFGILRNQVRDRRKSFARRSLRVLPSPEPNPSNPEGAVLAQQKRARVRLAVADLPEPQREVVTLFYLEELPVAEVAARLGVAEGTVKSRLFQARAVLRDALEGGI